MRRTDEKYIVRQITRYSKVSKNERGGILDEFVKTTGYHRKYAIRVPGGKRKRSKQPIRRLVKKREFAFATSKIHPEPVEG